ncbi:MAG: hypothetical protein ACYDBS_11140, partial [Acidimicrobiales bacterium]
MTEEPDPLEKSASDGDSRSAREAPGEDNEEKEEPGQARAPWHFKVIVVGSVVYLGYRLYQGIAWLA